MIWARSGHADIDASKNMLKAYLRPFMNIRLHPCASPGPPGHGDQPENQQHAHCCEYIIEPIGHHNENRTD